MKPIAPSQTGPAVEDVQSRLVSLGFDIDPSETGAALFGRTTADAVRAFRVRQGLPEGDFIDDAAWIELVDETYELGDRTLYLRLPFFHGADVKRLQMTLNVLGFSCGEVDGLYGPHTEAAVAEFQSNVGLMADGMAFQDTFDAIERLHHVWRGKVVSTEFFNASHVGLVRAVDVLESKRVVIGATDPIARNVASRLWNLAYATTADAQIVLVDAVERMDRSELESADVVAVVATAPHDRSAGPLPKGCVGIVAHDQRDLTQHVTAALVGSMGGTCCMRIELPDLNAYDGSVTARRVQNAAVMLLDALCAALAACA